MTSGKFVVKDEERKSAVGYMTDFAKQNIAMEDIPKSALTPGELDGLVALAHKEAVAIARDILHLQLPKTLPITLVPIGASAASNRAVEATVLSNTGGDKEEDLDSDVEEDEDGDDGYESDVEPPLNDSERGAMASNTANAAMTAARYSALCEDIDDFEPDQCELAKSDITMADAGVPISGNGTNDDLEPRTVTEAGEPPVVCRFLVFIGGY